MAKNKLELNKSLKGTGVLNIDGNDIIITIAGQDFNLKEQIEMFKGEEIKFSFGLSEIIVEE